MAESPSNSGIERALQVIFAVASAQEPDVGISELSRSLGLSKAVVHRVVRTLVAADFFAVDEKTRRYRLGPKAVSVGLAAMAQMEVPQVARPFMERLVAETQETSTLSVRYGNQRMYLAQVLSPQEIRMSVQMGILYPLHAGSSSKAILSALEQDEVDRYVAAVPLRALTNTTMIEPADLVADLAKIRERGYSVSLGERQNDAASVAAPIREATGAVFGSLSVCGPINRFTPDKTREYGEMVREAARAVSAQLGYHVDRAAVTV